MLVPYKHVAPPPGHPCPWWYQAMHYLWWRIGQDMMTKQHDWQPTSTWFACSRCGKHAPGPHATAPDVSICQPDEKPLKHANIETRYEIASGGAYRRVKACHHHPTGCPKSGCTMK